MLSPGFELRHHSVFPAGNIAALRIRHMKPSWNITRLCLAAGLVVSVFHAAQADEESAGVVRISKPRDPNAAAVQQTGFLDRVRGEEDIPSPHRPAFNGTPFRNVGYHGGYEAGPPVTGQVIEGEAFIVEDGDCDCYKCRKFRKHHHRDGFDDCDDNCKHGHGRFCNSDDFCNYFACKFGCLVPSGHGGAGSPFFGHYARVYPQDVNHFDQRDGQLYGAQGYGVPIAVPLAPVVGHTYNYGWGVPSSRLTPISHLAPR